MTGREQPVCADCKHTIPLPGERGLLVCLMRLNYCAASDQPASCTDFGLRMQPASSGDVQEQP